MPDVPPFACAAFQRVTTIDAQPSSPRETVCSSIRTEPSTAVTEVAYRSSSVVHCPVPQASSTTSPTGAKASDRATKLRGSDVTDSSAVLICADVVVAKLRRLQCIVAIHHGSTVAFDAPCWTSHPQPTAATWVTGSHPRSARMREHPVADH
jgi:hypothetical protein